MKTKYLIILYLTFCNAYSQNDFLNFNRIKINDITKIEEPFNSIQRFDSIEHGYFDGETQVSYIPITYFRPKSMDYLKTYVDYHNHKNDSLVADISYGIVVDRKIKKSKFFEKYNQQFNKLVEIITQKIGKPSVNKSEVHKCFTEVNDKNHKHFQRRLEWKNENCEVLLYLIWSENHGEDFRVSIKFLK